MQKAEALNYINKIDQNFYTHKKEKVSRYSTEWGTWSRKMNIELRENEKKNPLLVQVFSYWIIASKLLELYFKFSLFKQGGKNKLKNEMIQLRESIKKGEILNTQLADILTKGM